VVYNENLYVISLNFTCSDQQPLPPVQPRVNYTALKSVVVQPPDPTDHRNTTTECPQFTMENVDKYQLLDFVLSPMKNSEAPTCTRI